MDNYRFVVTNDGLDMCRVFRMLTRVFPGSSLWLYSTRKEALQHIVEKGADLLITNEGCGDLTANELIGGLRRRGVSIPILMYSADLTGVDGACRAGVSEFLPQWKGPKALL